MIRKLTAALFAFAFCVAAHAQSNWALRADGIGPVKIGMTLPQLNRVLHEKFSVPEDDRACFYAEPRKHPQISFMIEDGHLVRIDVNKADIATERGIRIGDTESRVKIAYGGKVKVEPSKYTGDEGGHYLTIRSPGRRYGTRFETEHDKVTTFYAGKYEAVQYVEGCS